MCWHATCTVSAGHKFIVNALHHILVVDDEAPTRWGLSLILERAGYRVIEAPNGKQALKTILAAGETTPPIDLLILDLQLPVMTGLELLDAIEEKALHLPVLVITGYSDEKTVIQLCRKGCQAYLEKPFKPSEVLERVEKILKNPPYAPQRNPINPWAIEQQAQNKGDAKIP